MTPRLHGGGTTPWQAITRADRIGSAIADRHYSRQTPGAAQFVGPGRDVVLLADQSTADAGVLWVSLLPLPEHTKHDWPGAWMCTLFRNERPDLYLSSDLIRDAVAITRYAWGEPPEHGMVTFVNAGKVRRKRDPGRCFRKAGFRPVGYTRERNLLALQLLGEDMPPRMPPSSGDQLDLWDVLTLGGAA